jgi:hypothetical protein
MPNPRKSSLTPARPSLAPTVKLSYFRKSSLTPTVKDQKSFLKSLSNLLESYGVRVETKKQKARSYDQLYFKKK